MANKLISFKVDDFTLEEIERIKSEFDLSSNSEVFKKALSLLMIASDAKNKGDILVVQSENINKKDIEILL